MAKEAQETLADASSPRPGHVRRALGYLGPYRRTVVASVVLAFLAGGVFVTTVPAMFPILQVLLQGDTPQMWIDRLVAEARWGIDLADDAAVVRVVEVEPGGPAEQAYAQVGDARGVEELNKRLASGAGVSRDPAELLQVMAESPDGGWMGGLQVVQPRSLPMHLRLGRQFTYALPSHPVWAISVIMVGIVVLAVLSGLSRFAQEYLSAKAAHCAVNDIRRDLYDHVLRAPMSYFARTGTSDVTSRLVSDAAQLQGGFTTLLGPAVQQPIFAVLAFLVAMVIDWRLTILILCAGPVILYVQRVLGRKMRRAGVAMLANSAQMLEHAESTLSGIRVVKANVAEEHEAGRLRQILNQLLRFQLKLQKYDAVLSPVTETLAVVVVAVIAVVMVYLVRVQGSLNVAGAIIIFGCLAQMADAGRRLSRLNAVLQRSKAAAERIFETMDQPREQNIPAASWKSQKPELRNFQREIAFENVSFRYDPEAPPALDDISLSVRKGESIAIVGRNGSGKTTLLSLLPRFFEPESGRVLVDGVDIRDVSLASLRSQIGVVTQEAVIFPGTIAQNIAYARVEATRDQIESAARQAEAHEFIMAKAQGYDTSLSGLGSQLSGGQRQRLNIARAILRDPPILILDEATSQVDAESEHLIQQAIHRLMQGRTVFVIAHRFSTILDCDRIALLERGRLEALGTHEELLETSDLYRQLYDRQLVGV